MTTTFNATPNTSHIRRFGKANGAINYRSREAIPLSDLRQIAPAIFAEDKHESRSDRYTYIPTAQLLTQMEGAGFRPFAVMQGGSRDQAKREFTKHLIRFRHVDAQMVNVGDSTPEIMMINSHDGTSSYQLMTGIFRLVCSNGMVVSDALLETVKVKHTGSVVDNVIDGCIDILGRLPIAMESVREMQSISLTSGEQRAFANAALAVRYESPGATPIHADDLLSVRRAADNGPDLWRTLNRVQERIVRGGVNYVHVAENGQRSRRSTREVNGIDQNTALNRGLWTLAEEMKKLKA
jgi:hypothetical protein